jgi:glycosyltransferase involved in cell wall biosynthesis
MEAFVGTAFGLGSPELNGHNGILKLPAETLRRNGTLRSARALDAGFLRQCAWEIGAAKPAEAYAPGASHVALAMVSPHEGFAHWHLLPEWIEQTARNKDDAWRGCRLVLRLYDVSYITFTGLNAHRIDNIPLDAVCGQTFFKLRRPGTWQLAEVGFELTSGEFVPGARSQVVQFPPDTASTNGSRAALFVDSRGRASDVGNLWEQERILIERRKPKLREPLRIAAFTLGALRSDAAEGLPRFVAELAAAQVALGHEVHVFAAGTGGFSESRDSGVHYHAIAISAGDDPLAAAQCFAANTEQQLRQLPPFDVLHLHEWGSGLGAWVGTRPTVLSLHSIEATRRNGTPPNEFSLAIQRVEREVAQAADCVLLPDWLRPQALADWGVDGSRVHGFPLEGRLLSEWEWPLDLGEAKKEIGFGPLDRLVLFIGPLEHAAGVDLLIEALPVLLRRWSNLRLAVVGAGAMHGPLAHRTHELGLGHAVRLLGHVEGPIVPRLVRSAAALALPSRYRVPFDDAVVDLARRAGRPVITTHGGPAHLVRHEETGIVTYDNPGSMVWAIDRIVGDAFHADRMGANGRRTDDCAPSWRDLTRHYLDFCAAQFAELTEPQN